MERLLRNGFVVGVVGFVTVYAVPSILFNSFFSGPLGEDAGEYAGALLGALVASAVALLAYRFVIGSALERRRPAELVLSPSLLAGGTLLAAVMFVAVVAVMWLLGSVSFTAVGWWPYLAGALAFGIKGGVVEELFYRGLLFRLPERLLGTWLSLALSAVIFGLGHLSTPGATWWTTVSLVLTAGIALGAAYVATGSLWLPIGLHAGWNLTQAAFGLPVSGHALSGLLDPELSGPTWLTGGDYGPEASVVSVVIWAVLAVLLLRHAVRTGRIVAPRWRRSVTA